MIVTRSDLRWGSPAMSATLLQLMEELLQAIEQRDAGDPDAPAWEACARIERLEEEIAQRLSAAGGERSAMASVGIQGRAAEATAVTA
jgi:hypothetical protein